MQLFKISGAVATLLVLFCLAWADVPRLINFQGCLRDGSGNPVAISSDSVTFKYIAAPPGVNEIWAETQSVNTVSGLFSILLGSSHPLPDSVFNDTLRWLGIRIDSDPEMAPRQRLVSVGYSYRVGTVDEALGGNILTKVSIGPRHVNTGTNAFVAGENNKARGNWSTVSGGGGSFAFDSNAALGNYSAIGGGNRNTASGENATVGGGGGNTASGFVATVGGGTGNTANGYVATVGGGYSNEASSNFATVGGGIWDTASDYGATVSGGELNTASGNRATVSGGTTNYAIGDYSLVCGGSNNAATNTHSTVGGGGGNIASGIFSTVPGGVQNVASGPYTFASGRRAKANHVGTFVWADSSVDTDFASTASNQFLIRVATVGIGTNSPQGALDVNSTSGGFIVPRMTTTQRNTLTAVNGMIIYNTTDNQFNFYENGAWVTK